MMEPLIPLSLCAGIFAGLLLRPAVSTIRHRRHPKNYRPSPYLGEFVPPETDAQRAAREREEAARAAIMNAGY